MNPTIEKANQYVMNTYASFPLVFEKGEGCYLTDDGGKKYLDFVAGIAVNALGYGHKKWMKAITDQLEKVHHLSNLYYNEVPVTLAEKLCKSAGLDKAFFCNSGAESIEAALKLARIYAKKNKSEEAFEIVAMENSFHGRTFGALSATGQKKHQMHFDPMLPQVHFAAYNDIESLKSLVTENTAAVLLEPIQGEGGINPAKKEYLKQVRALCDEKDIVLIFDEVQSGIGRTGSFFAYQQFDVVPDIVTCAKGLAGGVPMGAIIAKEAVAKAFEPGSHASTFGGNPLSAAAALCVVDLLNEEGLLEHSKEMGQYLGEQLKGLVTALPDVVKQIKGLGLMAGIEVTVEPKKVIGKAMEKGLLIAGAGSNVLRLVPPLIVSKKEIDQAVSILKKSLEEVQ